MSFIDVSRNCFQSGISATRWLNLCKTFIAQNPSFNSDEENAKQISDSVLQLYKRYPGEPRLTSYLKHAIEDGLVPLPAFVSRFLDAATSNQDDPPFPTLPTLDALCELAVTMQQDSGNLPYENSLKTLTDAGKCLQLLHMSYRMHLPGRHQKLTQNSGKLLMNMLFCVTDYSQLSVDQVWIQLEYTNALLLVPQLDPGVKEFLGNLRFTLTLMAEDLPKPARDAQMLQQMQVTQGDIGGHNSEDDVVTLGLLWQYLVNMRGHEFGAGHTAHAVALLISTWRSSSWSPNIFYTQVIASAFNFPGLHIPGHSRLWKAFVVGRLPTLLAAFQAVIGEDQSIDWRTTLQHSLVAALRDYSAANNNTVPLFTHELLQHLVRLNLIDQQVALDLDPSAPTGSSVVSYLDTTLPDSGSGADVTATLELKLNQDLESPDVGWFDRVAIDISTHTTFANLALKKFSACSKTLDVEALSSVCRLLYSHPFALDLLALHVKLSDVIFYSLSFLEHYDCETVGDPQTAVGHLGHVVLFVQYALGRFQLEWGVYAKESTVLSADFLRQTHDVFPPESLSPSETASFNSWYKALFDSSSEGIEDSILRSTHPKTLLRISATLFFQAIKAASSKTIDAETLVNGVSYFTGPLLNWTLVGVVEALIRDAQSTRQPTPEALDVLQSLLLSSSCPKPVHALCRTSVLRYLADKGPDPAKKKYPLTPKFNVNAIRAAVRGNSGANSSPNQIPRESPDPPFYYWLQRIQTVLMTAQTNKACVIDVDAILRTVNPTTFMRALWENLLRGSNALGSSVPPNQGALLEGCRRVGTFVLTMPMRNVYVPDTSTITAAASPSKTAALSSTTSSLPGAAAADTPSALSSTSQTSSIRNPTNRVNPPLLPLFLHVILPALFTPLMKLGTPTERLVELVAVLIVSTLTAAQQLEWALATVMAAPPEALGVFPAPGGPNSNPHVVSSSTPGNNPLNSSTSSNPANTTATTSTTTSAKAAAVVDGQPPKGPRPPIVLGSSSSAMARRVASDLKARKDNVLCRMVLQRLGSSESFVGNFPYFGSGVDN